MSVSFFPARFGIAGIIDLTSGSASMSIEWPTDFFHKTPATVSMTWHGDGITAVTYQHREEAHLEPGKYKFQMPQTESCQGVAYGQFFGADRSQQALRDSSWPEVISTRMISGYCDGGLSGLADLNGAFVGVIWDKGQRRAIFPRDVAGVETMYVARHGSQITFASDLRVLRALDIAKEFDEQAMAEFMHFLYVPNPRTIYKDIHAVLPGHVLVIDQAGMHQERFAPPRFVQGVKLNNQAQVDAALLECLPRFEELLLTAASDCIPDQGRIGLLLTGGKDSSTLAIALSQVAPDRVMAFTVGTQDPRLDESKDAARLCEHLAIPHQTYTPESDELVTGVKEMVRYQDQPFGDLASLPLFLGLQHLPEDVSVVWDGTGNDYYFGFVSSAGRRYYYQRVKLQQIIPEMFWPAFVQLMRLGPQPFRTRARKWVCPIEDTFVSWYGWSQREVSQLWKQNISFADTHLYQIMRHSAPEDWRTLQTEVLGGVWEPQAAFRKTSHFVHEATGRAMRFPFIDNRLAQFTNTLPQELQFVDYTNKVLLRAYLAKHLPPELLEKPKGDFVFDLNLVLQYNNRAWPDALREAGLLRIIPGWSNVVLEKLLSRYEKDPDDERWQHRLYALCLIATWASVATGHPFVTNS